jgi:methylmalonic aciduria homocystinuria type C protein
VQLGWPAIVDDVRGRCARFGLELVQPFQVAWYNRAVPPDYSLPEFDRSSTLGILIGNTRAIWPCFIDALRANPEQLEEEHPLDNFTREVVLSASRPIGAHWDVRWSHEPAPRRVAMQRLADLSGMAHLSPSHLNVHPRYGPWIAFRAVIIVDVDGPDGAPPVPLNPCSGCAATCLVQFQHAAAAAPSSQLHDDSALAAHWRLWLAVRDLCPVGREHRYDDDQIRYHYTKDRAILAHLVRGH